MWINIYLLFKKQKKIIFKVSKTYLILSINRKVIIWFFTLAVRHWIIVKLNWLKIDRYWFVRYSLNISNTISGGCTSILLLWFLWDDLIINRIGLIFHLLKNFLYWDLPLSQIFIVFLPFTTALSYILLLLFIFRPIYYIIF